MGLCPMGQGPLLQTSLQELQFHVRRFRSLLHQRRNREQKWFVDIDFTSKSSNLSTDLCTFVDPTDSSAETVLWYYHKGPNLNQSSVLKAQVNEVAVDKSSNSSAISATKFEVPSSHGKDIETAEKPGPDATCSETSISAFMSDVANLVKLVDSRDIMELQLKNLDCELTIRKKEALPPPPSPAPVVMMHTPSQQAMLPPQLPSAHTFSPPAAPLSPPSSAPPASLPAPAKPGKSGHPPLKCPMAGTFYGSPAPGEPSFVKVGDKVQKGQVVGIIEAMKLMNEIEADQSGTIVEILAEDGKTVSVDMPLLVIEP